MEFKMRDNAFLGAKNRSLWWEEAGRERTLFTDVTFSFTIHDANEGVIGQKEVVLINELQPLFSENYNTEIVDKGFKVRKLYFTKREIMAIYKMAEQKLETAMQILQSPIDRCLSSLYSAMEEESEEDQ